jgi:predicted site-specific integrase-resolvase
MPQPAYHKEWCEAQGLNYATARRYIKKPSAQTAKLRKLRKNLRRKKCALRRKKKRRRAGG